MKKLVNPKIRDLTRFWLIRNQSVVSLIIIGVSTAVIRKVRLQLQFRVEGEGACFGNFFGAGRAAVGLKRAESGVEETIAHDLFERISSSIC